MFRREDFREIHHEIRKILMQNWDPIGVSDVPMAADEYDMYIGGICGLLDRNAGMAEIVAHLQKIEVERMGLTDSSGKLLCPAASREGTARTLISFKESYKPAAL